MYGIAFAVLIFEIGNYRLSAQKITNGAIAEKHTGIVERIEMLSDTISAISDNDRREAVRKGVISMDNRWEVYAAAYVSDSAGLTLITPRNSEHSERSTFDPVKYPDLYAALVANQSGDYIQGYTPDGRDFRNLHIHYQWVPKGGPREDQYLVIAGISKYSINNGAAYWDTTGHLIGISVTFLVCLFGCVRLIGLGHVWDSRRGEDKFRSVNVMKG